MSVAWLAISLLAAFALGCFNTGYYLVRVFRHQDIRMLGSGSTGARNVARIMGWKGFFLTFFGDALKGWVAVWFAKSMIPGSTFIAWALPCLIIGHLFPIQLGFRGGKGIAVAVGGGIALIVYGDSFDSKEKIASTLAAALLSLILIAFAHRLHWKRGRLTWKPEYGPQASKN